MIKRIIKLLSASLIVAILFSKWATSPVPNEQIIEVGEVAEAPVKKSNQLVGRAPASSTRPSLILKKADRKIALTQEDKFRDSVGQPMGETIEPRHEDSSVDEHDLLDPTEKKSEENVRLTQKTDGITRFSNQSFSTTSTPTSAGLPAPRKSSNPSNDLEQNALTCAASIGAGTYSSPRMVTITCSRAADIRYCLQENTCCDPQSGVTYTGPFTVGSTFGDFCLSIQGENDENQVVSEVSQINLQFNPDVPHLVVEHSRRYWQTGQLSAQMSFVSDNFGSPNLEAGILNLLTNNISPSGLNLTCEQIVENYTTLTTPAPLVVMPAMAVDSLSPTIQLDVWLTSAQLNYGDNYVTTHLKNNNYGSESFACSTTKLVLEDFDFFTEEATQVTNEVGLNGYLLGGLTTFGHFEEDSILNRSPAGSMIDVRQDQELRTGMLGIFF